MPWIWGEMNQLHGRIDIQFTVKGKKATGTMRFKSNRESRRGLWETEEWSLETTDGKKIDLLDEKDSFRGIVLEDDEIKTPGRGSYSPSTQS
jgi:cytochrome c oxidase assembly factor 1